MLRVLVEVQPHGDASRAFDVVELFVGNDGTGDRDVGSYDVYSQDPHGQGYPRHARPGYVGRIENLNREGEDRNRPTLAMQALKLYVEAQERL